jgi:hypothetical protein
MNTRGATPLRPAIQALVATPNTRRQLLELASLNAETPTARRPHDRPKWPGHLPALAAVLISSALITVASSGAA